MQQARKSPLSRRPGRNSAAGSLATRQRIVNAASRLFAERGFANASMPAIALRCGITPGAIYRHFASKAELLLEVVRSALQSLPLSVQVRTDGAADIRVLPKLAAAYTTAPMKQVRRLSLEVHAAASRDPDVRRLLSVFDRRLTGTMCQTIAAAAGGSGRRTPRDAELRTQFFATVIMGLNHMDTLHPHLVGNREWREFVAAQVARLMGLD